MALNYKKMNSSAGRSAMRESRPQSGDVDMDGVNKPRDGFFPINAERTHPKFGVGVCIRPGANRSDSSVWQFAHGNVEIANWFWPVKPGYIKP